MPILQQSRLLLRKIYLKNKVDLAKKRPEKSLTKGHHRKRAETYGRITSRVVGGVSDCTGQLTSEGIDLGG